MKKPQTQGGYTANGTDLAEQFLLEIWRRLGDYHAHLVLVGGLAPRYIINQPTTSEAHCGTLDIDLAVDLAISEAGAYSKLAATLEVMGLEKCKNENGTEKKHSFVMAGPNKERIELDLLTTEYDGPQTRVRPIDGEISAIQAKGLGLALIEPINVALKGKALRGGDVEVMLRVCRPIPFIVLKSIAFEGRAEAKDAYDLTYVLRNAPGGPTGLAQSVRAHEYDAESFKIAIENLAKNFETISSDGPVRCANFKQNAKEAPQAFATVREFLAALRR